MKNLKELFVHELQDLLHAEKQLVKALPKMAKAASSAELRKAFESHLSDTKEHVIRLEQVFDRFGESPDPKRCEGMEGILAEGEEMMEAAADAALMDAGLIAAAQKAEHYEIASYGCLCAWAELLGEEEALDLLKQNQEQEEAADRKLTNLAETSINPTANNGAESEEEETTAGRRGHPRT
jgi:ferritin-like metal-binding protein YciE